MKAEYVDHMGDDLRVVNAARVSFDKESSWDEAERDEETGHEIEYVGSNQLKFDDIRLVKYLASHGHWTPFSHPQITLRETVPIFVARQRFKHTVGFAYNEVSRRYVSDEPDFYWPGSWRGAPTGGAKQGSSGGLTHNENETCNMALRQHENASRDLYNDLLKRGVAPEQARMVLPQSMFTSYYVTGSLAAWARAYKLRIDTHSQKEIRDLAVWWGDIIAPLFPVSWKALT